MNHELLNYVHGAISSYCQSEHKRRQPGVVRLHEPTFSADEIRAAVDVLLSRNVTAGKRVVEFEFAFFRGLMQGVMCNSGSSANLLAVAALSNPERGDLVRGDKVIVSALSWSTTVWPLVQYGLIPVIVDIDPDTLNMDIDGLERAISPDVKAVMPVHVYGNPCDMTAFKAIVDENGLYLIEDCCESMGAEWSGRSVGTFGTISTFSFYFSHHITTIEGGMCVAKDPDLINDLRILRAHGWIRDCHPIEHFIDANPNIDPRFLFVGAGYNLRPTELQAAMGLAQLPKLDTFVTLRREAARMLQDIFEPYSNWLRTQKEEPNGKSSRFGFPLTVLDGAPFSAKDLRAHLEANGIETRPIICGNIAKQPGMMHYPHTIIGDLANATKVMRDGLSIPCHQDVDGEACDHIKKVVDEFMRLK